MSLSDDTAKVSRLLGAAGEKIRSVRYCWMLTAAGEGGMRARPMGRLPRDADEDEWTLRFITDGRSPKVADIRRIGDVSVIFQQDPDDAFVALAGKASLVVEKPEIPASSETLDRKTPITAHQISLSKSPMGQSIDRLAPERHSDSLWFNNRQGMSRFRFYRVAAVAIFCLPQQDILENFRSRTFWRTGRCVR
jgi:hypothetical protein